jgi:hypothetical protein
MAGVDLAALQRRRAPPRLVEALLEERARDLQADVDADEVHELERPHAEAAAEPADAVDLLGRGEPLVDDAQRLQRERAVAPVDEEPDPVGDLDDTAAHRLRRRAGDGDRVGRGVGARHDLDEAHDRRRVEEVHPDDAVGRARRRADRGHRQRRGVRRQDGPGVAGELAQQLALELQALGRRLDDEVAGLELLERADRAQALACALHRALRPRRLHACDAAFQGVRHRVVQHGLKPRLRGELGDPGPHRPGTDDADDAGCRHGRDPTLGRCAR